MTNIVQFGDRRAKNKEVKRTPLDVVDDIFRTVSSKEVFKLLTNVKEILSSRGVKFRVTSKEVDQKIAPKNKSVLFPDLRFALVIGGKKKINQNGWSFLYIDINQNTEAIDIASLVFAQLEEVAHGQYKE